MDKNMNTEPVYIGTWNGDKVLEEIPELGNIIVKWYELSSREGDRGACVLGAGFGFIYNGTLYFMCACSPWQGSLSWEAHKDEIQQMLSDIGAKDIRYNWGVMD